MRQKNSMKLVFLFVFYHFISLVSAHQLAPALYVFGDSLVDSGNNDLLPTMLRADYWPYGMNFPQGTTGRFTNGKTCADFLAEYLKLPYAPSFLSLRISTPVTGLNYASGSCGILPLTGQVAGKCLSLDDQLNLFEDTVKTKLPPLFQSTNDLKEYLSKSIFLITMGSNDYIFNYFGSQFFDNFVDTSKLYTPQAFAKLLLDGYSKGLQRLYNLGARKLVVVGLGPIGCMPSIITINGFTNTRTIDSQGCVEEVDQMVSYFNDGLSEVIQNLRSTLPDFIISQGSIHQLIKDVLANPSKYGITATTQTCCKTWPNGTTPCIPWQKPCANPNQHVFFDGFHPTEAVYGIVANHCLYNSTISSPTVEQLVQM